MFSSCNQQRLLKHCWTFSCNCLINNHSLQICSVHVLYRPFTGWCKKVSHQVVITASKVDPICKILSVARLALFIANFLLSMAVVTAVLIRAARCDNAARPLCFAAVSFFLKREISAVSQPVTAKLCHILELGTVLKTRSKIWGSSPQQNLEAEKHAFLTRFWMTSHFDREYLRNRTRYRQSENGVANYDLSRV